MNILLGFGDERGSLGRLLKRALAERHSVWSCGPVRAGHSGVHEIPAEIDTPLPELAARCPEPPDAYLHVDTGVPFFPRDVDHFPGRRIWFFTDPHVCWDTHREWGLFFHGIAVPQAAEARRLTGEGFPARWIPFACDDVHRGDPDAPREYDLAFVGTLRSEHPDHAPRIALLNRLSRRYQTKFLYGAFDADLSAVYASARIVVNRSIHDDVNMRVFEALASGSLLLTDRVPGLSDLFADGLHLAVYEDDRVEEAVDRWLADAARRRAVARAGQAEAFRAHTYAHRAASLLAWLDGIRPGPASPVTPFLRQAVYAKAFFNLGQDERGYQVLREGSLAPANIPRFRWYRRAVRFALRPLLWLNRAIKWLKRVR